MKCVAFERDRQSRIGIVQDKWIVDVEILFRFLAKSRHPAALKNSEPFRKATRELLKSGPAPSEVIELLAKGRRWLALLEQVTNLVADSKGGKDAPAMCVRLDSVRLQAPVLRPGKTVCVGQNYAEHARESGSQPSASPIYFLKSSSAICPPGP